MTRYPILVTVAIADKHLSYRFSDKPGMTRTRETNLAAVD
jgi:hypothetical protein